MRHHTCEVSVDWQRETGKSEVAAPCEPSPPYNLTLCVKQRHIRPLHVVHRRRPVQLGRGIPGNLYRGHIRRLQRRGLHTCRSYRKRKEERMKRYVEMCWCAFIVIAQFHTCSCNDLMGLSCRYRGGKLPQPDTSSVHLAHSACQAVHTDSANKNPP